MTYIIIDEARDKDKEMLVELKKITQQLEILTEVEVEEINTPE
jgi:hypothetical protein